MNVNSSTTRPVRILVVDDHPNTAALLARAIFLSNRSLEVISATSGQQALEHLQDAPADIVITDMDMPELNGLELIEKLNQHPAGPPTCSFLLTASHMPGLKMAARRLRVEEVISKPISPQTVCQIVSRALEGIYLTRLYKELISIKDFKILIADDDTANVTLLSRYLEGEGYAYTTANDGLETIQQIHSYYPDLILLGPNMPEQNVFDVLQEIRTHADTERIPVVLLSADWSNDAATKVGVHQGLEDYVTMPIDRRELLSLIRRRLLEKELEQATISRKAM